MPNFALSNEILLGSHTDPAYRWENDRIQLNSPRGVYTVDTICNELSIDEFSFVVRYNSSVFMFYQPTDALCYRDTNGLDYGWETHGTPERLYLTDVAYGAPVWHYVDGDFFVKGYIKSIERIAKHAWKIVCQSAIGLLDAQNSVGGMFTGEPFMNVLAGIALGYIVPPDPGVPGSLFLVVGPDVSFEIADGISSLSVYGRLPYATRRQNLHALLFATGAVLTRASDDIDYRICYPTLEGTEVPPSRIAISGSVSVQEASNQAEITEHSFIALPGDAEETLFDNTGKSVADHELVVFSDAMHDLAASANITVHESNCNYAIVSGSGTLTGKRYTHVTRIVTASSAGEGDVIRAKRVESNELISAANSLNTARRVLSYYSSARTLKSKLLLENERPGILLALNDAFGDPTTAYLRRANVLITSVRGADCELVEGYVPSWGGNNYTHRIFIDQSGSGSIPAGVRAVRLIIIQGGDGGQGGYNGERGYGTLKYGRVGMLTQVGTLDDPMYGYHYQGDQPVPAGGAAGDPGASGKIYIIDIETNGGEPVQYSIGRGGNGGAAGGHAGAAGGESTVTINGVTYSSASGSRSAYGFVDMLGDAAFAMPGELGHRGGNGGTAGITWHDGANGEGVGHYNAGQGGKGYKTEEWWVPSGESIYAGGGGAGGAAWGADGGNGGDAVWFQNPETSQFYDLETGAGGTGATATAPAQPTYGCGGAGGNGGGAGGNVAGGKAYQDLSTPYSTVWLHVSFSRDETIYDRCGGPGGAGSAGGHGGDGCVIVYY